MISLLPVERGIKIPSVASCFGNRQNKIRPKMGGGIKGGNLGAGVQLLGLHL